MEAFQVRITAKGGAAPGTTAAPLKTDAAARVGSSYYKTFNEAFDAMPDRVIYVRDKKLFGNTYNDQKILPYSRKKGTLRLLLKKIR